MTETNQTSNFEKRIKSIQSRKKRNFIIKVVSFFLTFVLIFIYFLLPISKVSNSTIEGNIFYTKDDVLTIAGLSEKQSLYLISKDKIKKNLINSPLIEDQSVKVNITPGGLKIEYEELVPVLEYDNLKYLSNGTLLDEDLIKSKDPLVGDYLYLHTQNLIPVYSKPFENKFVKTRVEHLSKLILSLDENSKSKIIGVDYNSENYYYSFYYQTGLKDDTILKVVFDSAKKIDDLKLILDSSKVERYISYLEEEKTKDNFVSFKEIIKGEEKDVKSIKVIMQTIDDEVYYHVKYNNPDDAGSIG